MHVTCTLKHPRSSPIVKLNVPCAISAHFQVVMGIEDMCKVSSEPEVEHIMATLKGERDLEETDTEGLIGTEPFLATAEESTYGPPLQASNEDSVGAAEKKRKGKDVIGEGAATIARRAAKKVGQIK